MKKQLLKITALCCFGISAVSAQVGVTVNTNSNWTGYANVFDLGMGYQFGSGWGLPDMKTVINTTDNTLSKLQYLRSWKRLLGEWRNRKQNF